MAKTAKSIRTANLNGKPSSDSGSISESGSVPDRQTTAKIVTSNKIVTSDLTTDLKPAQAQQNKNRLATLLLKWYDTEQRELPWRAKPGQIPNPYHVWLSEIMLQQTVVKTVIPYFNKFITLWPELTDLANATRDEIRTAWAGLGYYSRAANLHKCAQIIRDEYDGKLPIFEEELITLPGIGPYTAAAIAAIAFDETATPVDGNIERVMARQFALETPLPTAKKQLKTLAASLTPPRRAGDYAQALMDLGATICTPKNPSCLLCPVSRSCEGYHKGIAALLPARVAKKPKPTRYGTAFFVLREDAKLLLRQREEGGLLGGMTEVPGTIWSEKGSHAATALKSAPVNGEWWQVPGLVKHTFTHFHLELTIYRMIASKEAELTLFADSERCKWVHRDDLAGEALPSVMRKVINHALSRVT